MNYGKTNECLDLVRQALEAIQSNKLNKTSLAVRKLEFCSKILEDKELERWCEFQLGGYEWDLPLAIKENIKTYNNDLLGKIGELGLKAITGVELSARATISGGGFKSVEFIEATLNQLIKQKSGNDGTYYVNNLQSTLVTIANSAYAKAVKVYKRLSFGEIPSRQFDFIRDRVDGLLLDICPDAIEKFMVAYERLSSNSSENWSQALTACRRVIKSVADAIYPPKKTSKEERKLGEEQYINRLWAFLDENAGAGSDKDLAKAHVNYLGAFIQKLNDKASKGVHADVRYEEAVKSVLYTYLTLGDILDVASDAIKGKALDGSLDINSASFEELKAVDGITESTAKEIIKRRVIKRFSSVDELSEMKGVGKATVAKINKTCRAV